MSHLEEKRQAEEKIKRELAAIREEANNMLIDSRYRRIRSDYETAEEEVINYLLECREEDPVKFKSKINEWLIELRIIRSLLDKPVSYVEEKPKPSFNFITKFLHGYKKDLEKVVDK